jgi:hypothetical protein
MSTKIVRIGTIMGMIALCLVASFVGTIDPKTGTITPVIIGMGSPTGLAFLPNKE